MLKKKVAPYLLVGIVLFISFFLLTAEQTVAVDEEQPTTLVIESVTPSFSGQMLLFNITFNQDVTIKNMADVEISLGTPAEQMDAVKNLNLTFSFDGSQQEYTATSVKIDNKKNLIFQYDLSTLGDAIPDRTGNVTQVTFTLMDATIQAVLMEPVPQEDETSNEEAPETVEEPQPIFFSHNNNKIENKVPITLTLTPTLRFFEETMQENVIQEKDKEFIITYPTGGGENFVLFSPQFGASTSSSVDVVFFINNEFNNCFAAKTITESANVNFNTLLPQSKPEQIIRFSDNTIYSQYNTDIRLNQDSTFLHLSCDEGPQKRGATFSLSRLSSSTSFQLEVEPTVITERISNVFKTKLNITSSHELFCKAGINEGSTSITSFDDANLFSLIQKSPPASEYDANDFQEEYSVNLPLPGMISLEDGKQYTLSVLCKNKAGTLLRRNTGLRVNTNEQYVFLNSHLKMVVLQIFVIHLMCVFHHQVSWERSMQN